MPAVSKINNDLQEEREKVKFNVEEFTNWYYGGADKVSQKRELEKYFLSDPELNMDLDISYLSYKEKYEEAIRRNVLIYRKLMKLLDNIDGGQDQYLFILRNHRLLQTSMNKEGDPFLLQFSMFVFMIMNLTNDEQLAEWLPRVIKCNLLGTYAQTELGHGSNLKGLETTAIYDPKTKEFVINTPTLTAHKWWPGNLGHTVNYAVVMAQLYSLGKHHGIHPFIVQLRDEETHKPLAGITVGDIGNKLGYNSWNNGYLAFDNVRIPRKNMLMKSAEILENGEFKRLRQSVTNYGAMVQMRVSIVADTAMILSKAVTIACRYSMVRRQSPINPDEPEPKIIEHVTQQYKIFPALTRAIVYNLSGRYLTSLMNDVMSNPASSDRIPEFHALSCGLKAVCTTDATRDVEICRLSCGGHGFLESAGLANLYRYCTAGQTGEGENTVVLLQTAKFLLKSINNIKNGEKVTAGVKYIKDFLKSNGKRLNFNDSVEGMLNAIRIAAAGTIESAWKNIESKKKFMSIEQATNHAGIELVRAAELHCYAFFLETAINELRNANISTSLGEVMENILELFAVDLTLNLLGDILQYVNVTNSDIEKLQTRLENSLKYFRTAAIGIVDGFIFSDEVLSSTLGSYDGNVYERLYEAAKKSPLNQEDVNKSFHLYLKPFMKSNL